MRIILAAIFLLLIHSAQAAGPVAFSLKCLNQELADIMKEHTQPVLSHLDRNKITETFESITLSETQKAQKSFDIYIEALKKHQNDVLKSSHIENLKKSKYFEVNAHEVQGYFPPQGNAYQIKAPKELENSLIDKFISVHEIKHGSVKLDKRLNRSQFVDNQKGQNVEYYQFRYLDEEAAMSAEWEYLNAIPQQNKIELNNLIKKHSTLGDKEKEFIEICLLNSNLSCKEYLEVQRNPVNWRMKLNGRYDQNVMQQMMEEDYNFRINIVNGSVENKDYWKRIDRKRIVMLASVTGAYTLACNAYFELVESKKIPNDPEADRICIVPNLPKILHSKPTE